MARLNEALSIEADRVLILNICSINGALFHLRQMLRDPRSKDEWIEIAMILCKVSGLVQNFAADMEYLILEYPSSLFLRAINSLGKPSREPKELAEMKASVERHKAICMFALRNNPT